ncbi:hypothetical protein, partial [Angustibacter aerolatus]
AAWSAAATTAADPAAGRLVVDAVTAALARHGGDRLLRLPVTHQLLHQRTGAADLRHGGVVTLRGEPAWWRGPTLDAVVSLRPRLAGVDDPFAHLPTGRHEAGTSSLQQRGVASFSSIGVSAQALARSVGPVAGLGATLAWYRTESTTTSTARALAAVTAGGADVHDARLALEVDVRLLARPWPTGLWHDLTERLGGAPDRRRPVAHEQVVAEAPGRVRATGWTPLLAALRPGTPTVRTGHAPALPEPAHAGSQVLHEAYPALLGEAVRRVVAVVGRPHDVDLHADQLHAAFGAHTVPALVGDGGAAITVGSVALDLQVVLSGARVLGVVDGVGLRTSTTQAVMSLGERRFDHGPFLVVGGFGQGRPAAGATLQATGQGRGSYRWRRTAFHSASGSVTSELEPHAAQHRAVALRHRLDVRAQAVRVPRSLARRAPGPGRATASVVHDGGVVTALPVLHPALAELVAPGVPRPGPLPTTLGLRLPGPVDAA